MIPTLRTGRAHPHPEPTSGGTYSAVELMPGDRAMIILDQTRLPALERYDFVTRVDEVADAILALRVRGAPAIGIAAAYAIVLASVDAPPGAEEFLGVLQRADGRLRGTRPTAVNLAWALERMRAKATDVAGESPAARTALLAAEARALHAEDVAACRALGKLGAALLPNEGTVLTHCNAGALATGGYGTALGVVRAAKEAGKSVRVLACETRPLLQGSRLTAWELHKDGIPVTVLTDSMVASRMARGEIGCVIVGADRIARNGDVANKIGTYGIACLAKAHDLPFYVAAPWSTVDRRTDDGGRIPIEERAEREVTHAGETRIVAEGVPVLNPAFDVTPGRLVSAIVTERGVARAPYGESLAALDPAALDSPP